MAVGTYPTAVNPVTGALYYPAGTAPSVFTPADHGLLAWSYDIAVCSSGTIIPTAGLLQLVKLKLDQAALITNLVMHMTAAGVTLTAGQNFAALYSSAGALLSVTADQSTAWQSSGLKSMALAVPQTVPAGDVYVGFWSNGSTLPTPSRSNLGHSAAGNVGLSAPNLRFATANTGLTTTAPPTFGAQTALFTGWWVAVN